MFIDFSVCILRLYCPALDCHSDSQSKIKQMRRFIVSFVSLVKVYNRPACNFGYKVTLFL